MNLRRSLGVPRCNVQCHLFCTVLHCTVTTREGPYSGGPAHGSDVPEILNRVMIPFTDPMSTSSESIGRSSPSPTSLSPSPPLHSQHHLRTLLVLSFPAPAPLAVTVTRAVPGSVIVTGQWRGLCGGSLGVRRQRAAPPGRPPPQLHPNDPPLPAPPRLEGGHRDALPHATLRHRQEPRATLVALPAAPCSTTRRSRDQYTPQQYSTVQYISVQYSTVHFSTLQVQYSTVRGVYQGCTRDMAGALTACPPAQCPWPRPRPGPPGALRARPRPAAPPAAAARRRRESAPTLPDRDPTTMVSRVYGLTHPLQLVALLLKGSKDTAAVDKDTVCSVPYCTALQATGGFVRLGGQHTTRVATIPYCSSLSRQYCTVLQ